MNKAELKSLQIELQRNRTQSYIFLALLVIGVLATAYAFHELDHAKGLLEKQKEELESQKQLIEAQKEDIKAKNLILTQLNQDHNELLSSGQENEQKQDLIKEISTIVLKINSTTDVSHLSSMSVPDLEKKIAKLKKEETRYDQGRVAAIKSLFNTSESKRKIARKALLKQYSTDPLVITNFLAESQGKINLKSKETYYQFIYLLTQLDSDVLKENQDDLLAFFETGEKAGLNGPSTKKQIASIKRKMR